MLLQHGGGSGAGSGACVASAFRDSLALFAVSVQTAYYFAPPPTRPVDPTEYQRPLSSNARMLSVRRHARPQRRAIHQEITVPPADSGAAGHTWQSLAKQSICHEGRLQCTVKYACSVIYNQRNGAINYRSPSSSDATSALSRACCSFAPPVLTASAAVSVAPSVAWRGLPLILFR